MSIILGITVSFLAALMWGLGDFFIQKSTRKVGVWESLFILCLFGAIVLLPFCFHNLLILFDGSHIQDILITSVCGFTLFFAAMLIMQGMKLGKLSVIEPLYPLEIMMAGVISYFVLRENLSYVEIILMAVLILCFILLSTQEKDGSDKPDLRKLLLEKGVLMVAAGSILMGVADFFMGWGARVTDALTVNFIVNVIVTSMTLVYLVYTKRIGNLFSDIKRHSSIFLAMSVFDNAGWVLYAYAMVMAPIAIVTTITESSIIVAIFLGLFINKEKLQRHQYIGITGAAICAIALGLFGR